MTLTYLSSPQKQAKRLTERHFWMPVQFSLWLKNKTSCPFFKVTWTSADASPSHVTSHKKQIVACRDKSCSYLIPHHHHHAAPHQKPALLHFHANKHEQVRQAHFLSFSVPPPPAPTLYFHHDIWVIIPRHSVWYDSNGYYKVMHAGNKRK